MQQPIQQLYTTQLDLSCEKCKNSHGPFVGLACNHVFCVMCLTFMFAKYRHSDERENTVKCLRCGVVTELHPSHLDVVNRTIAEQVIPKISDGQLGSKGSFGLQHTHTVNRKIKSEEHSFEHNITPSTNKAFFSKCESPSTFKKQPPPFKRTCQIHRGEPIMYLCFSCQMEPLCMRCTNSNKNHHGHSLKDIQKGLQIMLQQASDFSIDLKQKISTTQIMQRRQQEKISIIESRANDSINQIKMSFQNLIANIKTKQNQILQICNFTFNDALQKAHSYLELIRKKQQRMQQKYERISLVQKESQNIDFIFKWEQIRKQCDEENVDLFQSQSDTRQRVPTSSLFNNIDKIATQVCKLGVIFKLSNISRVGTSQLENCRSESKFRKEPNKRLRTNFASLNSSREKKIKKNTKTEEDQGRMRTEKAPLQKNKKKPNYIPSYILKHTNKFGSDGCHPLEMTTTNIDNSKLTSKLSKTISPEELNRKKKDNMAMIKQRIERKTIQPSVKKADSSKKKKAH